MNISSAGTQRKQLDVILLPKEVKKRLQEFQNINLDDFYTNGLPDWDKVIKNGNTHLVQSITLEEGKVIDFKIYNDNSGYIYLITSEVGLTKIGCTKNVQSRLSQIDMSSPCAVSLYYSCLVKDMLKVEKLLHDKFKDKRKKGEWFEFNQADLEIARDLIDAHEWKNG